jgi:hypothetical protein
MQRRILFNILPFKKAITDMKSTWEQLLPQFYIISIWPSSNHIQMHHVVMRCNCNKIPIWDESSYKIVA